MNAKELYFYFYRLNIDNENMTEDFLRQICNQIEKNNLGNKPVAFEIKFSMENFGIWFSIQYGKTTPYSEKTLNVKELKINDNKRSKFDAELRNQIFMFYSYRNKDLLISNSKTFKLVEEILSIYAGKKVQLIKQYKDADEFIKSIKTLEKITFNGDDDLFTYKDSVFYHNLSPFGIDGCGRYKLEVRLKASVTDKIKDGIRGIKNDNARVSKRIEFWGRDERGFEKYFNTDYFRDTITLMCNLNSNSMFIEEDVRNKLLMELGK